MIYLKAKIQDLLDNFQCAVDYLGSIRFPTAADMAVVDEARKAILDYWERGEA